ncbi:MAG: inositol monophosphatase family protein [Pseudomonadota bacterium]
MIEFQEFIQTVLIPKANEVLSQYYSDYCEGKDIDIQTKADESPASLADREAERELRVLINQKYPEHGIWGEEFGAENLDAEYVWVLDPLDGTKQFLNKQEGCFVVLIGLFKGGKPYIGAASDPLSEETWLKCSITNDNAISIEEMVVASTASVRMFERHKYNANIQKLFSSVKRVVEHRNAKSFLDVIDGYADIGIEADLSLHDIGALIPVCSGAGCIVTDFEGNDYTQETFEFNRNKYDFLITRNQETTNKILKEIRK